METNLRGRPCIAALLYAQAGLAEEAETTAPVTEAEATETTAPVIEAEEETTAAPAPETAEDAGETEQPIDTGTLPRDD